MGFNINFLIRDSTLQSRYTQTEGAGQQTKISNELHTWTLNECSQKSLVTTSTFGLDKVEQVYLQFITAVRQVINSLSQPLLPVGKYCWTTLNPSICLTQMDLCIQVQSSSSLKATLTQLLSMLPSQKEVPKQLQYGEHFLKLFFIFCFLSLYPDVVC